MALTTKLYGELPPDFVIDRENPGYPLPQGIIVEKDVLVEMRDGCELACNVFRPDKPGKFAVILDFTVYGKDVYGWHKACGVSEVCRTVPGKSLCRELLVHDRILPLRAR